MREPSVGTCNCVVGLGFADEMSQQDGAAATARMASEVGCACIVAIIGQSEAQPCSSELVQHLDSAAAGAAISATASTSATSLRATFMQTLRL